MQHKFKYEDILFQISFWIAFLIVGFFLNNQFSISTCFKSMFVFLAIYLPATYIHHYIIWANFYSKGKLFTYCAISLILLVVVSYVSYYSISYIFSNNPEVVKFYNVDRGPIQYMSDAMITIISFSIFHLNKDFLAFQRRFDIGDNAEAIKSFDEYQSAVNYETLKRKVSLLKTETDVPNSMISEISELEELMNYQFERQSDRLSLLQREVKHLEEYIDLFQKTSEKDYRINLHLNGEFENYKILNHSLIPFADYVIKRGVPTVDQQGSLEIAVSLEEENVFFIIKTAHPNYAIEEKESTKMRAVKNRLQKHYAWRHELIINENEKHFNLFLKLPKETA